MFTIERHLNVYKKDNNPEYRTEKNKEKREGLEMTQNLLLALQQERTENKDKIYLNRHHKDAK